MSVCACVGMPVCFNMDWRWEYLSALFSVYFAYSINIYALFYFF